MWNDRGGINRNKGIVRVLRAIKNEDAKSRLTKYTKNIHIHSYVHIHSIFSERAQKKTDKNITTLTLNFKCYKIIFALSFFHWKTVSQFAYCELHDRGGHQICVCMAHMKSRWSFHINCITFVMRPRFPCTVQWNSCYQMTLSMSILFWRKREKITGVVVKEEELCKRLNSQYFQKFNVVGGKKQWVQYRVDICKTYNFFPFLFICNRRNGFDCAKVLTVWYHEHTYYA